jgi:hypothetical protein
MSSTGGIAGVDQLVGVDERAVATGVGAIAIPPLAAS